MNTAWTGLIMSALNSAGLPAPLSRMITGVLSFDPRKISPGLARIWSATSRWQEDL